MARTGTNPHMHLYNSGRWKHLRRAQLDSHPLCQRCEERGTTRVATVAHHRVPHRGDEQLFFDPTNLASSCADCHDVDEQRIEHGGKARALTHDDGWPTDVE